MSPNRASSLLRPFLDVFGVLFIVFIIVGWWTKDDYEDDDFTVTITYECEKVLNGRDYPGEVIAECLDLRNEIRRRNHP